MADNQPANPTAPEPASPQNPAQEPATKPADAQPAAQPNILNSLSEEEKSYLRGQGIEDLNSPESIRKIIQHGRSSQKTASEIKAEYDKVKNIVSPQQEPTNPFAPKVEPQATPTQQPTQPQQQPARQGGIDPVTAFTLSTSLATNYSDLKDELISGQLYRDMEQVGIPLTKNDGQVNIEGITNYAKFAQQQKQLAARQAELDKPGENAIPDANPTPPQQPAADAPMDGKMARAIIAQDKNHPRFKEAMTHIQQERFGKK